MRFEKLKMKLAWALPKDIAYWAAIRVGANACGSKYPKQVVPELLFSEVIQRWPSDPYTPPPIGLRFDRLKRAIKNALTNHTQRVGLIACAIALEADDLETLPEFQRGWYAQDAATKKYKLDPSKVEVEDVGALRATVAATREEAKKSKESREQAVRDALKPFEGIDPVKTRAMLDSLASEEEKRLMAQGPEGMKKVIDARMENQRNEFAKQVEKAVEERDGALEVATRFMERVLDNHVRAAANEAGMHPGAIDDALLRARSIFSLNDEGDAVQFAEDGETVVMGKDGKSPFAPKEWLEQMKEKAPHWWPAAGAGGGAGGGKGKFTPKDMSGLSPQERMTKARGG